MFRTKEEQKQIDDFIKKGKLKKLPPQKLGEGYNVIENCPKCGGLFMCLANGQVICANCGK